MLNRRHLFGVTSAAVAVAAVPLAAQASAMSRAEAIQHHQDALLDLIRVEYPDDITSLSLTIVRDLETGKAWLSADGRKKEWKADPRLHGGGHFVEWSQGEWTPERGMMHWGRH